MRAESLLAASISRATVTGSRGAVIMLRKVVAAVAAISLAVISLAAISLAAISPAASAPAVLAASDSSDTTPAASSAPNPLDTEEGQRKFLEGLNPQRGVIALKSAGATLQLGKGYYFLGPQDSQKVLVDAWRNPKDQVQDVLGMVFPSGETPLDSGGWGAVVTFRDTGYVPDKDARSTDYGKVLDQMRQGEDQDNDERKKNSMPSVHLAGWAQAPSYDGSRHALIWARDLQFGDQSDHTLNYDIRVLGRRGVLSLNMVASMSQLPQIRTAANELQGVATFDAGSRYADYQEGVDKKAAYGLAGLVLAGAGLAVAQKAGLLALALLFLKKGFILIAALFAGGWAWLRRLLGGRKKV